MHFEKTNKTQFGIIIMPNIYKEQREQRERTMWNGKKRIENPLSNFWQHKNPKLHISCTFNIFQQKIFKNISGN